MSTARQKRKFKHSEESVNGKKVKVDDTSKWAKCFVKMQDDVPSNETSTNEKRLCLANRVKCVAHVLSFDEEQLLPYSYCLRSRKSRKDFTTIVPDEIILEIFKLLPNYSVLIPCCSLVCKRWNKLSYDGSLWRKANLDGKVIQIAVLKRVLTGHLKDLSLKDTILENKSSLLERTILTSTSGNMTFYNLLNLNLTGFSEIRIIEEMLSLCYNLKLLNVSKIKINDTICNHIAINKKLEVLKMCKVAGVTALAMVKIFGNCRMLRQLDLQGIHWTQDDLDAISSNIPTSVITLLIHRLRDQQLEKIIRRCPNMVGLDITKCFELTVDALNLIVLGLPKLQCLRITCADLIQPENVINLNFYKKLNSLKYMGLGIEDVGKVDSRLLAKIDSEKYEDVRSQIYNYQ